jgi:hypothetical protein
LSRNLTAINAGFQPHVVSYTLLVLEFSRVFFVFIFVYLLDLGLDGAIFALFLAQLIQVSYQTYLARTKLKAKFQFNLLKNWIKLSWLTIYSAGPNLLRNFDLALYAIITSSVIGVAFYAISLTIGRLVSHSEKLSQGLYPKLLSGGDYSHISNNFSLLLLFGLPVVGLSIVFSKPGLYALNPIYLEATSIVILLSLQAFFLSQSKIIQNVLLGIDKSDISINPSFQIFVKSNLFKVPSYQYIKLGIYLTVLIPTFYMYHSHVSEIELVTLWALIALFVEIPFLILMWVLLFRKTSVVFPFQDGLKYFGATIAFMFIFWQTSDYIIIYHESIFDFLPTLLIQFTLCVFVYFGITYLIDKKTRVLYKTIIKGIKSKIKHV